VSVTLAIGIGQSSSNSWDFWLVKVRKHLCEDLLDLVPRGIQSLVGLEAWHETCLVERIRQSEPKVYVDGQLAAPLEYGHGASMNVQVPGEGEYSIVSHPGGLSGWVEAGHIHDNLIEFQAGSKQVRIECNKPIVDSDRPVFAMHRP
jgi:hypothetical protein